MNNKRPAKTGGEAGGLVDNGRSPIPIQKAVNHIPGINPLDIQPRFGEIDRLETAVFPSFVQIGSILAGKGTAVTPTLAACRKKNFGTQISQIYADFLMF